MLNGSWNFFSSLQESFRVSRKLVPYLLTSGTIYCIFLSHLHYFWHRNSKKILLILNNSWIFFGSLQGSCRVFRKLVSYLLALETIYRIFLSHLHYFWHKNSKKILLILNGSWIFFGSLQESCRVLENLFPYLLVPISIYLIFLSYLH